MPEWTAPACLLNEWWGWGANSQRGGASCPRPTRKCRDSQRVWHKPTSPTSQQDIKVSRPVMWAPGVRLSPVRSGFPRSPPGGPHLQPSPQPPPVSPGRVSGVSVRSSPGPEALLPLSGPQIRAGSRVPELGTESQVTAATTDQAPPQPQPGAWPCAHHPLHKAPARTTPLSCPAQPGAVGRHSEVTCVPGRIAA